MPNYRALIIGVNYVHSPDELSGCVNDAMNMYRMVRRLYRRNRVRVALLHDYQRPKFRPTRSNIIRWINWLVRGAKSGDHLFVHYSGHGGYVIDQNNDESDARDETIIPSDFRVNGEIIDDELKRLLVNPLPAGVNLHAVFDSCHSGTALDLRERFRTQFAPSGRRQYSTYVDTQYGESAANVCFFSGCLDPQYSYETVQKGKPQGAMSRAYQDAYILSQKWLRRARRGNRRAYVTLQLFMFYMCHVLNQRGFDQNPQMSTGGRIGWSTPFTVM